PFRTDDLVNNNEVGSNEDKNSVPLLWMNHLNNFDVEWPLDTFSKPQRIEKVESSANLLVPVQNYVLLKRFSAKEQKQRLIASVLTKNEFKQYTHIGLEITKS
ncbi:unnamed protein product, partial [marine sediment metagenome]